ncbi:MAG TPA: deoxyribodipyrimidine photo-lyase [Candidatus Acidoferrum sp.]|jgi:deoxyribodipyrimidine photo-lyase|nr:deoxyribodipyrimidine photo-lyase [Candidatus Acidoferrum sp.]
MDWLSTIAGDPRVTVRSAGAPDSQGTCVVYWMQRAQRGIDNPALDVAVEAANALEKPVVVFFAPVPFYPHANLRHYRFLNEGIPDIARALAKRSVGFILRRYPEHSLLKFCEEVRPALVVGDENPMREPEGWRRTVNKKLKIPLWTVDADVIVPSKLLEKAQYAAHTIRPRLQARLKTFLIPSRNPRAKAEWKTRKGLCSLRADVDITEEWKLDRSVSPVTSWRGGTAAGMRLLNGFVSHNLRHYAVERNKPELDRTSRLSPYLHFGQISPIAAVLAVQNADAPKVDKEAFLNEILVWRELAINLVRFNSEYDSFECGEAWAHKTLAQHASDPRTLLYTQAQLESAETHDALWNAAQMQMVSTGWMHNYMRMYWAKKILEWSRSPADAYRAAVYLNDKYFLDGRDPNGYAGIAWAIVGKFDRPWFERPIFGQIRYMSGASTGKKFDSKMYIQQNLSSRLRIRRVR